VVRIGGMAVMAAGVLLAAVMVAQEKQDTSASRTKVVSFKDDVYPILKKRCISCHAVDEDNPSELALDDYETMMKGGKHGDVLVPGKAGESLLVQKLREDPPFGKRMPLNSRKKIQEGKAVWLTPEQEDTIATWVSQGAKDN
jgi:hypothetical protein